MKTAVRVIVGIGLLALGACAAKSEEPTASGEQAQTSAGSCVSGTLRGEEVIAGACVQDSQNDVWYRCNADKAEEWTEVAGPAEGDCTIAYALCKSGTLGGRKVPYGTCVQDSQDGQYYFCGGAGEGDWQRPALNSCRTAIQLCSSGTLGRDVAEGTCVQDKDDQQWYRCGGSGAKDWSPVSEGADGCMESFPLRYR